jgi:hypothetical protein
MPCPYRFELGRRVENTAWVVASSLVLAGCGSDPIGSGEPKCGEEPTRCAPTSDHVPVTVSAARPTFVKLGVPGVVTVGDPTSSTDWDLMFQGYDVFTNGGISGPGLGSAFGPLPASSFAFPDDPISVPFLIEDRAEGAFLRWYAYDGATHTIYSRYHVYGIRSRGALYKVQVLSYYSEIAGAPVGARYHLLVAAVDAEGSAPARELLALDGTVGGGSTDPSAPSGCVTLDSEAFALLSPEEASASSAWDLCFRRDSISVNGELGGPGGVTAVDLQKDANEPLGDVKALTVAAATARFDAVDATALEAPLLEYRGDHATSAFSSKWADLAADPPVPVTSAAWLVVAADGRARYLVGFDGFEGATTEAPGTIDLFVHPSP